MILNMKLNANIHKKYSFFYIISNVNHFFDDSNNSISSKFRTFRTFRTFVRNARTNNSFEQFEHRFDRFNCHITKKIFCL